MLIFPLKQKQRKTELLLRPIDKKCESCGQKFAVLPAIENKVIRIARRSI